MTACLLFMIDLYCVLYHNIDLTLCGVLALCIMCLGTEPWPFYFINGFLNFNVVFVLALLSLPLTALMEALLQRFNGNTQPHTQPHTHHLLYKEIFGVYKQRH